MTKKSKTQRKKEHKAKVAETDAKKAAHDAAKAAAAAHQAATGKHLKAILPALHELKSVVASVQKTSQQMAKATTPQASTNPTLKPVLRSAATDAGYTDDSVLGRAINAAVEKENRKSVTGYGQSFSKGKIMPVHEMSMPKSKSKKMPRGPTNPAQFAAACAALARYYPDEMCACVGPYNFNGLDPESTARSSVMRTSLTLIRNTSSLDANYYGCIFVNPAATGHLWYSATMDAANPPTFATYTTVNDPIVAGLGSNVAYVTPTGMCFTIKNSTSILSQGGTAIGGNIPYSTASALATNTFNTFLANPGVDLVTLGGMEPMCFRWSPDSSSDVNMLTLSQTSPTTDMCLLLVFRSVVAASLEIELVTNWTIISSVAGRDLLQAKPTPVDDGYYQDAIAKIQETVAPDNGVVRAAFEKDDDQPSSLLSAAASIGKTVVDFVEGMDMGGVISDISGLILPLFGSVRMERMLLTIVANELTDMEIDAHPNLPPGLKEDMKRLLRWKVTYDPDQLGFELVSPTPVDGQVRVQRWIAHTEETKDLFQGSTSREVLETVMDELVNLRETDESKTCDDGDNTPFVQIASESVPPLQRGRHQAAEASRRSSSLSRTSR